MRTLVAMAMRVLALAALGVEHLAREGALLGNIGAHTCAGFWV